MTFVLDGSVTLAWCFDGEQTPPVMELLDRASESGATVPILWPLETLNGLIVAERRRRIDHSLRIGFSTLLRGLPIEIDKDTIDHAWTAAAHHAERFGLTIYDATYLELAIRRGLPLATLDCDLRRAGETVGLELLGL